MKDNCSRRSGEDTPNPKNSNFSEITSKDDLDIIASISHEIRTPVNAIVGIAELLQDSPDLNEQQEYLDILQIPSKNLLELVNNVLYFSKVKSGKLKITRRPIRLRKIIHDSLLSQKANARANNLELLINIDERIPYRVWGDPVKLSQILINLTSNAIKFTHEGSVELRADLAEEKKNNLLIRFSVKDTGIGIAREQLQNIFRAFEQGEEEINIKYAGTGLGLSIAGYLVNLLEGKFEVQSKLGKGSEFSFMLPMELAKRNRTQGQKSPKILEKPSLKGLKTLLVEDNKVNMLITGKYLQRLQAEYTPAFNGREALQLLEQEDFDLVLLDLQMPKMDGFETARKIRKLQGEKFKRLPILALSAHSEELFLNKVLEAGMNDYITKPFNPSTFYDKLQVYHDQKKEG